MYVSPKRSPLVCLIGLIVASLISGAPAHGEGARGGLSAGERSHAQYRLRFSTADDEDGSADAVRFFSGDAADSSDRARLVVTYH